MLTFKQKNLQMIKKVVSGMDQWDIMKVFKNKTNVLWIPIKHNLVTKFWETGNTRWKLVSFIFFQTSYGLRWMSAEEREVNKQTISAVTLRSEESQYFEEKCICLQPHNCWDLYEIWFFWSFFIDRIHQFCQMKGISLITLK